MSHKCDLCEKSFGGEEELLKHKQSEHKDEGSASGTEGMVKGA